VGPANRPGDAAAERPGIARQVTEAPVLREFERASESEVVRPAPSIAPAVTSISMAVVTPASVVGVPATNGAAPHLTNGAATNGAPVTAAPMNGEHAASPTAPADGQPNGAAENHADGDPGPRQSTCTTAQLRRFIKSRAYLPMHELRRRFAIEGAEDDVVGVDMRGTWVYVGLPDREGSMLGELLRGGEVGFELSHDPVTPVIVGVFPMRPIPRS
jgi:hypothetical protein